MPASYTMQTILSSYFLGVKGRVSLTAWKNDTEGNVKNGTKRTGSILKTTIWAKK